MDSKKCNTLQNGIWFRQFFPSSIVGYGSHRCSSDACRSRKQFQVACQRRKQHRTAAKQSYAFTEKTEDSFLVFLGDPVRCAHGIVRNTLVVKKAGPNKGRRFYSCGATDHTERCGLFVWDTEMGSTSNISCGIRPPETPLRLDTTATIDPLLTDSLFYKAGLDPSPGLHDLCPEPSVHHVLQQHLTHLASSANEMSCWDVEQGTAAWFLGRSYRVTASVAAAAAGLSTHQKPTDVARGLVWKTRQDGVAMRWGKEYEDTALAIYTELLADTVDDCEVSTHGLWIGMRHTHFFSCSTNPALPYIGASPDAVVTNKNTGERWCVETDCFFFVAYKIKQAL